MQETSTPAAYVLRPEENLTDVVAAHAASTPQLVLLSRPGAGGWAPVTAAEFLAEVVATAKGLVAAGVQAGDRVALLSKTRYEWTLFDVAIWFAGAITVPVYETSSAQQVQWILADSGAVVAVVETAEHAELVARLRGDLPDLQQLFTIDHDAVGRLARSGQELPEALLHERRSAVRADSVATIIYTSGTTGRPKGCELTHGNFLALTRSGASIFTEMVNAEASTLLFLPLAHVFARYIQVLCLVTGATLAHTPTVTHLLEDLAAFRPTFLLAVPRVFEKIYAGAEAKARSSGRGPVFERAAATAIGYSQALDSGGPGLALRCRHALFDRLVYARLRAATGGRVVGAVSGGAPLAPRLGHFFRGVGIPVLEGWGLTETTAPATVNTIDGFRIGTVGRPLPGVSVKLAPDGELLIKGAGVLKGYVHHPAASDAALHEGWFSSGDLGSIDDDGFVSIVGRKKEILVTAGGKNVVPGPLEDAVRAHPLVSQCMVVGDQRPFVACLITLDADALQSWLAGRGSTPMELPAAAADPAVRAELGKAVDAANALVSRAEAIRKFAVLGSDFTEASGHLSPKLSLKRSIVMKDFADEVERLYRRD